MDVLRVVQAEVEVQAVDLLHLLGRELEAGDLEVAEQAVMVVRLGDDSQTLLNSPAEEDLSRGLLGLLRDGGDDIVREKAGNTVVGTELEVALRAERRVSGDGDAELLAESNEFLLGEVGVELDLVDGGLDASVAEDVNQERALEVGNTDVLSKTRLADLLHGFPGLTDGDLGRVDLAVETPPLRRVLGLNGNILEGDGEVDEVEVEVINAPELELVPDELVCALLLVVGVPELRSDENFLALDDSVLDSTSETLTSLLLVSVVTSTVEETVAGLQGVVDGICALGAGNLPETEASEQSIDVSDAYEAWKVNLTPQRASGVKVSQGNKSGCPEDTPCRRSS